MLLVLLGVGALVLDYERCRRLALWGLIDLRRDVLYGTADGEPLTLHLALPRVRRGPSPVIVFLHGGAWREGSKDTYIPDIQKAALFGYVGVSVDYRLAPQHCFPAQIEDCKCAIRWLRAHAQELAIDPQRIGAIGFSAGGHLALLLGTTTPADGLEGTGDWSEYPSDVQAVVSYFGPTDFTRPYPVESRALIEDFLGGTLDERPEVYAQASPLSYVSPGDAPTLLLHGTADRLVPHEQAVRMLDAFAAAGVAGRAELILGADHTWGGPELERTHRAAYAFFDRWLRADAHTEEQGG